MNKCYVVVRQSPRSEVWRNCRVFSNEKDADTYIKSIIFNPEYKGYDWDIEERPFDQAT